MDDEIFLLKQQENSYIISSNKTENNLDSTIKNFSEQVDLLGFSVNKLHNQVFSDMKDVRVLITILIIFLIALEFIFLI